MMKQSPLTQPMSNHVIVPHLKNDKGKKVSQKRGCKKKNVNSGYFKRWRKKVFFYFMKRQLLINKTLEYTCPKECGDCLLANDSLCQKVLKENSR